MNNLLKITTKPMKISVEVERGKFVRVQRAIKLHKTQSTQIDNHSKQQAPMVKTRVQSVSSIQSLPKNIKLNGVDNNIQTIIQQNLTQEESKNIAYLSHYSNSAKIEPIPSESDLKYQPGDLEFVVSQYSEIEFEYIGDPIYTPASANPNKEK